MITTCLQCGKLYEEQSEEEACSPDRCCGECHVTRLSPVSSKSIVAADPLGLQVPLTPQAQALVEEFTK